MKIDLGQKSPMPCCAPSGPEKDVEPSVHYPGVYIGDVKGLDKLPDSGTATFKFRVVERTKSTRGGKSNSSVHLEILSISDPKADEEKAEDQLDKLAEEVSEEDEH